MSTQNIADITRSCYTARPLDSRQASFLLELGARYEPPTREEPRTGYIVFNGARAPYALKIRQTS